MEHLHRRFLRKSAVFRRSWRSSCRLLGKLPSVVFFEAWNGWVQAVGSWQQRNNNIWTGTAGVLRSYGHVGRYFGLSIPGALWRQWQRPISADQRYWPWTGCWSHHEATSWNGGKLQYKHLVCTRAVGGEHSWHTVTIPSTSFLAILNGWVVQINAELGEILKEGETGSRRGEEKGGGKSPRRSPSLKRRSPTAAAPNEDLTMQLLEQNRIVLSNLNKVICVCSILLKGWSGRDRQTISAGWSKRPTHNPPLLPNNLHEFSPISSLTLAVRQVTSTLPKFKKEKSDSSCTKWRLDDHIHRS